MPTPTSAPLLVYFSSVSGNTARFIEKLGLPPAASRLPTDPGSRSTSRSCSSPRPTGRAGARRREGRRPQAGDPVPQRRAHRHLIRGVISAGNTNFGEHFCVAGDIISRKCTVPHLYRLELFGTPDDVARVSDGLERWWKLQ
jgi:protein involved in ribonucleotide reduction